MAIHELIHKTEKGILPKNPEVADIIEENIAKIAKMRRAEQAAKTKQELMADRITAFSGNMNFLYAHGIWFGSWLLVNVGQHPLWGFDPYPFGLLTMIVSLEAIFLATFVLISQNKSQASSDRRADLDLQINLLAEYEITRVLRLVDAIAEKMKIAEAFDHTLDELEQTTSPDKVMQEIAAQAREPSEE